MNEYGKRLRTELVAMREKLGGWQSVADLVQRASKERKPPIGRKQIQRLAEDGDFSITLKQMGALDQFLQASGRGRLVNYLVPPSVIDLIGTHGDATFVLGSLPDQNAVRIDLSRWDIRSFAEILNQLQSVRRGLRVSFEDVISREQKDAKLFCRKQVPEKEAWYHVLQDREFGSSIVCLGSPKANHCAEAIVARMFNLKPFTPRPAKVEVPFGFLWGEQDDRAGDVQSCVGFSSTNDKEKLLGMDGCTEGDLKEFQGTRIRAAGLVAGDRFFKIEGNEKEGRWTSYGVLAAYRDGPRVLLLVAGLTGPATYGGAQLLQDFVLSDAAMVADQTVAWVPYSVEVTLDRKSTQEFRKDRRMVKSQKLEGEVHYWSRVPGGAVIG